jgi:hypothetical protein
MINMGTLLALAARRTRKALALQSPVVLLVVTPATSWEEDS